MNEDTLAKLSAKSEELLSASVILIEKKMSDLMKFLAVDEDLYAIVAHCVDGFSYQQGWSKLFTPTDTGYRVNLPPTREETVAVVFCLMCEFEKDSPAQLPDLLDSYFSAETAGASAKRFQNELLAPFIAALMSLAEQWAGVDSGFGRDILFGYPCEIEEATLWEIRSCCDTFVQGVESMDALPDFQRTELLTVIQGFLSGVAAKERKLISVLFYGMKYALALFTDFRQPLSRLEQLLLAKDILM